MALMDIDAGKITDMNNIKHTAGEEPWNKQEDAYYIDNQESESQTYQMNFIKWHGMYRTVPFYKATVDKLAKWTVGKGYTASGTSKKILDSIRGIGKDSFNSILYNAVRTYKFGGDSYQEIIRNTAGRIVNIKPLDAGTIVIRANNKGIIQKYEQVNSKQTANTLGKKDLKILNDWTPKEIFHLSNERIADEIHGIPLGESLQSIIKKWENILDVMSVVYMRYVKPLLILKASTDDDTEINNITTKLNNTVKNMENLVLPEDVAELERMSIPQYSTLDPLPWIQMLQSYFIMSSGVPDVILGHSQEASEATSKIIYLAFQQTIEWEQLYIEEQVKNQLGQKIKLKFPASIDPSLLADSRKSGAGNKVNDVDPSNNQKG